jgi:hypothetical protein
MPLAIQVQLNDETPIRAGDDAVSVLTAMVTYVASRQETESPHRWPLGTSVVWKGTRGVLQRELRVGDRVALTVTDSHEVDPPAQRTEEDPEFAEQMEQRYYEQLKARFEPRP